VGIPAVHSTFRDEVSELSTISSPCWRKGNTFGRRPRVSACASPKLPPATRRELPRTPRLSVTWPQPCLGFRGDMQDLDDESRRYHAQLGRRSLLRRSGTKGVFSSGRVSIALCRCGHPIRSSERPRQADESDPPFASRRSQRGDVHRDPLGATALCKVREVSGPAEK